MDISSEQALVTTANVRPRRPSMREDELLGHLQAATLGEYEIQGELGRGGMAIVYLAHDVSLDRKVAIKVMTPSIIAGAGMVERFKREARTSARLSHPHIIPIYAVKEAEEILYFVMKFVPGRALDSIIADTGALPVKMVQAVLTQVGSALGYAHRNGVIHRDIKPGNVMIDEEGYAVVADFGIAKEQDAENLTQSGAAVGTPTYMSPEQCQGVPLSGATDQYSLGIVAYEMITGRKPFVGDTIMEIMKAHFFDPAPPIENYRPDCPPDLRGVVMRMLEKEATERFDNLEEMVTAVGNVSLATNDPVRTQMIDWARQGAEIQRMAKLSTPRSPSPTARPVPATLRSRPKRRGLGKILAAVVAALVLGVAVGGWFVYRSLQADRPDLRLINGGAMASPPSPDQDSGNVPPNDAVREGLTALDPVEGGAPRETLAVTTAEPTDSRDVPPPPVTGTVVVTGLPTSGTVALDGFPRRTRFDADPGSHSLTLEAAGFEAYATTITVVAGEVTRIGFPGVAVAPEPKPVTPSMGTLNLRIALHNRPTYANVVIDGLDRGQVRGVLEESLTAGISHRVRIERGGFVPVDTTVTLSAGESRTITIQLVQQR